MAAISARTATSRRRDAGAGSAIRALSGGYRQEPPRSTATPVIVTVRMAAFARPPEIRSRQSSPQNSSRREPSDSAGRVRLGLRTAHRCGLGILDPDRRLGRGRAVLRGLRLRERRALRPEASPAPVRSWPQARAEWVPLPSWRRSSSVVGARRRRGWRCPWAPAPLGGLGHALHLLRVPLDQAGEALQELLLPREEGVDRGALLRRERPRSRLPVALGHPSPWPRRRCAAASSRARSMISSAWRFTSARSGVPTTGAAPLAEPLVLATAAPTSSR